MYTNTLIRKIDRTKKKCNKNIDKSPKKYSMRWNGVESLLVELLG
jgi:hypothetical protein